MAIQQGVGVTADLTVLVPRDDAGTLDEGVVAVLERIDGVQVSGVEITGLTPRLNDMQVEATADVVLTGEREGDPGAIEGDPADAATAALAEGFGVTVEGLEDGAGTGE